MAFIHMHGLSNINIYGPFHFYGPCPMLRVGSVSIDLYTNHVSEAKGFVAESNNVVPVASDVKNEKALGKG